MSAATMVSTGTVARRLGVAAATVRRRWPDWHRLKHFPRPIALGASGLLRWDERQLEAWIAAGGTTPPPAIDSDDWSAIAAARGAALDAGQDPDAPSTETHHP